MLSHFGCPPNTTAPKSQGGLTLVIFLSKVSICTWNSIHFHAGRIPAKFTESICVDNRKTFAWTGSGGPQT